VATRTQSAGDPVRAPDPRTLAVRRVLLHVLALNALVVIIKLGVGWRTGALTVLGAALESGLDLLNNASGMILVAVAARAPDEDHPYGHAKFESMATLAIVGFLSITCFELLREGLQAFAEGTAPRPASTGDIAFVLVTLAVNAGVMRYERRRGEELQSSFLVADSAHTRGDIFVTLLAIASLGLTRAGAGRADAALAIAVAVLIAWSGWSILLKSVPVLVDARGMDATELRRIAAAIPGILEVRTVRSRSTASGRLFAEMTIGVDGSLSVGEAHALADRVEAEVERVAGNAEVVVHIEPA
jgi:cation diffusion facilitator family transporter